MLYIHTIFRSTLVPLVPDRTRLSLLCKWQPRRFALPAPPNTFVGDVAVTVKVWVRVCWTDTTIAHVTCFISTAISLSCAKTFTAFPPPIVLFRPCPTGCRQLHVCDLRRRVPAGGGFLRGVFSRRAPGARQAYRPVR